KDAPLFSVPTPPDICKPGNCTKEPLLQNPLGLDLDLVLLVDNSPLALPVGSLGRVAHLFSSILDHLKISPRPDYSLLWYYRVDTGSCNRFWYGGCGGNANRFNSEQDCIRVSHNPGFRRPMLKPLSYPSPPLDRDAGPCHSFALKWFFNKTQPARCTPFWYGGCEGNRNRFETQELCESTCLPLAGQMLLQQSAGESLQADESRIGAWKNAQICWGQIFKIAVHPTAPIKPLKQVAGIQQELLAAEPS
uniref:BPTI/Kunitz inhibitor domain-containing protein n=1 Tax=Chelonoidis abingdonii TaxID=106734 RepID=A0A8C0IYJ2_CHEAB